MLGYLVTCSGYHETTGCRDVKGVLAVTTSAHNVYISVCIENGWYTCLQDAITESKQFVHCHTAHLEGGQQGRNLFGWIFTVRDSNQYHFHFLTSQFLVVQHPVQDVFHRLCHKFSLFAFFTFLFFYFFTRTSSSGGSSVRRASAHSRGGTVCHGYYRSCA